MNNQFTEEYLQDILVRLAHHSSAIEGNTITLAETVSIILHNQVNGSKHFSLREIYEVKNHQQAFEFVIESIGNSVPLSIDVIKTIHEKLTDRLQHDKGQFKKNENMILGADFETTHPTQVPQMMAQLVDNLDYRLKNSQSEDEKLEAILETHVQFERIHPFSDGNGRTGRIVLNYSLLENDIPPLVIRADDKARYIELLNDKQIKNFIEFAKTLLEEEVQRMQKFLNKEAEQELEF